MTNVKLFQPGLTFDSIFDSFLNDFPATNKERFMPAVNISEDKDAYHLEFNVPGLQKDDFKITFDQSILTIAYDKKEEKEEETKKYLKREFSSRSFKRSFTLDEKIQVDAIEAKYENGVLMVALPKVEEVKVLPKEISVM